MNAQKIPHNHRGGFALVSAVSVLALLVLIGLAVLSLSTSTTREAKVDRHTEIARANARMALAIAIGHLQEAMGPDQRVSATADILNNDAPGGVGQQGVVEGREKWLGVWRNTRTVNGIDYPVIGKRPDDDSGNAPYELAGVYSDLRSTDSTLQGGAWKTEMHLSWLVSGNEPDALAEGSVEMEELVSARNSVLDPSTGSTIPAVSVPKVSVEDGNYAYWISEENQKAPIHLTYRDPSASGIADFPHEQTNRVAHLSAAPTVDVSAIRGADGSQPFSDFPELSPESGNLEQDVRDVRKLVTVNTASLAGNNQGNSRIEDFIHDVSVHSQGMAIDPVLGSLKRDLTAVLSGPSAEESIDFDVPSNSVAVQDFSSDFPIIPGFRHGFSGPKFGSLRHWAQMATPHGTSIVAETAPLNRSNSALAQRDDLGWGWTFIEDSSGGRNWWNTGHENRATTLHVSDGSYMAEEEWANNGAKFHPVMTDARWHYYSSPNFGPAATGGTNSIRFHMIPRVALWNPYNRPMQVPDMLVMMPNPFAQNKATATLRMGNAEVRNMRREARRQLGLKFDGTPSGNAPVITDTASEEYKMWNLLAVLRAPNRTIDNQTGAKEFVGEFTMRVNSGEQITNPDTGDYDMPEEGLVPPTRWIGFVLNATTLAPGQNAVYSPATTAAAISSPGGGQSEPYNVNDVLSNRLSATVPASARNSFYHNFEVKYFGGRSGALRSFPPPAYAGGAAGTRAVVGGASSRRWVVDGPSLGKRTAYFIPIDLLLDIPGVTLQGPRSEVIITGEIDENYPFMLKGINGITSASIDDIVGDGSGNGRNSSNFPTLQLMLHGNRGVTGSSLNRDLDTVASTLAVTSGAFKFTKFEDLIENQEIPRFHSVGTKMLWLDESATEAVGAGTSPYRGTVWTATDTPASPVYKAFNAAPVADWNLRAGMITRSPSSPSAKPLGASVSSASFLATNGAWSLQELPYTPFVAGGGSPQPTLSPINGLESTNPFIRPQEIGSNQDVVLFDIPDPEVGVLSLMDLRHAPLSQKSHTPSYIVGNSKADIHSPREFTSTRSWANATPTSALNVLANELGDGDPTSAGPTSTITSQVTRIAPSYGHIFPPRGSFTDANNVDHPATSEIPYFDISFETNQNLFDQFFMSGLPVSEGGSRIDWNTSAPSRNQRFSLNQDSNIKPEDIESNLSSGSDSFEWAFWNISQVLKVEGQFNVNSTSLNAWKSILGSNRQFALELAGGSLVEAQEIKFSRFYRPESLTGNSASLLGGTGWNTSRSLTEQEIDNLARNIVEEVKERGPFMSMADFINRRLETNTPYSKIGAIDRAIERAGLNETFVNELVPVANDTTDANSTQYQDFTNKTNIEEINLANSRAYGFPGYLMQADILAPLVSSMSVRGESFVIRTYGDSMENGVVRARAYLEAVVVRSPEYVDDSNEPIDSKSLMDYSNGQIVQGDLSNENLRFGRKFIVKSTRWISGPEV